MPSSKPSVSHARRFISQRIKIAPGTGRKLGLLAKSLGLRFNPTGQLLDLLIDSMQVVAGSLKPSMRRGYGRLSVAQIRSIRRSKDKLASIAAEHRISEAMVDKIRSRSSYRWVR